MSTVEAVVCGERRFVIASTLSRSFDRNDDQGRSHRPGV